MGEYTKNQKAMKYYLEHKEEYEEKISEIKYFFKIPVIYVKTNKYTKTYYLFNILPLFSFIEYN